MTTDEQTRPAVDPKRREEPCPLCGAACYQIVRHRISWFCLSYQDAKYPIHRSIDCKLAVAYSLVRKLRIAWFNTVLRYRSYEREWEDEEHQQARRRLNDELFAKYDSQTEALLSDAIDVPPVTPTCAADMDYMIRRR
jgi:hypothetical protein